MEEIDKETPMEDTPEDAADLMQQEDTSRWKAIAIVALVLLVATVTVSIVFGLVTHPVLTARLRDISIIVLALVTGITSIFLAILLFQLQSLIVLLRDEIQPILESVNDTAGTVRGTTTFVSDAVVTPMIRVASYASGVQKTVRTLVGGSSKPRSKRQASRASQVQSQPASQEKSPNLD